MPFYVRRLATRGLAVAIGLATATLAGAICLPLAAERDAGPPRAKVSIGARTEHAGIWSSTWTSGPHNGLCTTAAADGVPGFADKPIRVRAGHRVARITFGTSHRPLSVHVDEWEDVDLNGHPAGGLRPVRSSLRRAGGPEVRWMARVRLNVNRERYFDVFARWRHHGCGGGTDDASWSFHVAPRDPE